MSRILSIIIITLIVIPGSASFFSDTPTLPPPVANVALGVIAPVDHSRKVLTEAPNTTIQVAPGSPMILYVSNMSLVVWLDGKLLWEGNNTNGWLVLIDELSPGLHSMRVSAWNATFTIYVLSPAEEEAQAQRLQTVGDPWYYKYLYALIASVVAILAGYPLGIALRSRREERKMKKEPFEELRGDAL